MSDDFFDALPADAVIHSSNDKTKADAVKNKAKTKPAARKSKKNKFSVWDLFPKSGMTGWLISNRVVVARIIMAFALYGTFLRAYEEFGLSALAVALIMAAIVFSQGQWIGKHYQLFDVLASNQALHIRLFLLQRKHKNIGKVIAAKEKELKRAAFVAKQKQQEKEMSSAPEIWDDTSLGNWVEAESDISEDLHAPMLSYEEVYGQEDYEYDRVYDEHESMWESLGDETHFNYDEDYETTDEEYSPTTEQTAEQNSEATPEPAVENQEDVLQNNVPYTVDDMVVSGETVSELNKLWSMPAYGENETGLTDSNN